MAETNTKQLVVCINNEGYAVSLKKRKIYIALRDAAAAKQGLLRVVDESGQDYLYPKKLFCPITLPLAVKRAVLAAQERPQHLERAQAPSFADALLAMPRDDGEFPRRNVRMRDLNL